MDKSNGKGHICTEHTSACLVNYNDLCGSASSLAVLYARHRKDILRSELTRIPHNHQVMGYG